MQAKRFDIAVLGSGFAGSLTAMIARRLGLDVVLLEKDRHPRFAIGESSTPLANLMLRRLAKRYDFPWLTALSQYGSWQREYPQLPCGLKRGFSFFRHDANQIFLPSPNHDNELLVTANPNEEHGDTHWLRADFDAFFVQQAIAMGVRYHDGFNIQNIDHEKGWRIRGVSNDMQITLEPRFVVDATGGASPLASTLGIQQQPLTMRTHSRVLFSHFRGVSSWSQLLRDSGCSTADHPFPADDAALHHVFDDGWMWVLHFNNGITSAGFSLHSASHPQHPGESPEEEWRRLLNHFPSIRAQFASAERIETMQRTDRIQRRTEVAAGDDWAMLPSAAGFVDPWLSSGIALTLFGVDRLARVFEHFADEAKRKQLLQAHGSTTLVELDLFDRLTAACHARFDAFGVLVSLTMPYFVGAIYCEERLRGDQFPSDGAFLLAHDAEFVSKILDICDKGQGVRADEAAEFARYTADLLSPYNIAGLCDSSRRNMYPYITAGTQ